MKLVLAKIFFFTKRETHANSSTFCSTNMVNQKTHTKPHGEQMFFSSSYIHVTAYCGFVDFLLFSCIPTKMDKPWSGRKKSICIKLKLPTLLPQLNVLLCLTLQHIANRMEYGRCGALRRLIHFHSFYVQFSCISFARLATCLMGNEWKLGNTWHSVRLCATGCIINVW